MRTDDRRSTLRTTAQSGVTAKPTQPKQAAVPTAPAKSAGWTPQARASSHAGHSPAGHSHAGHTHELPLVGSRNGGRSRTPDVVSQDLASLMPQPARATLAGPRDVANFTFEKGVVGPAKQYTVTVGNHSVKVTMPVGTQKGLHNADIQQVARTLARMPAAALREVKEVRVSPQQNPSDAFWAQKYNRPDFRSYMTAGREGIVRFYPQTGKFNEKSAASSILHESGHVWSQREWGGGYTSRQWKAWDNAARADGTVVSKYGQSSLGEDVSETTAVYLATRGTRQHDQYRAMFPNRFAILDARFGAQR